ncbi:RiPP maturation radical SAM C-methyltransferase [Bradyrhizobium sp. HKCCYLRH3061]|uniref:RiPP maturation radical SAM C-methyltransferase n=1 Tax=Bradyrhizobium sp. HKCCYLRH3061 TaxID=3420734 RepID=UPI003EBE1C0A
MSEAQHVGSPVGQQPNRIALVCMPWASVAQPSLALGLIKAQLAEGGIGADVVYLNLELADLIGLETYDATKNRNVMASEWVLAEGLTGEGAPKDYLAYLAGRRAPPEERALWDQIRAKSGAFFARCLDVVDWQRYDVAAFTTSMMQTVASLNFARLLKARHPHLKVVLGGANCEGVMGEALHRLFPHVDVVVRGEVDEIVVDLFRRMLNGISLEGIPGLCFRDEAGPHVALPGRMVLNIEKNPTPDFCDYFQQLSVRGLANNIQTLLMFESSRGCWWGARSHCKFCALNGTGMKFRSKSVGRVVAELRELRDRHGISHFAATDNILDEHAVTELSNALETELPDVRVFYDVRATLTREELAAMARGGIDELEAGLENLTTSVLKRMGKGATGINNVRFLRRCLEFGISPLWNYLFGFPEERLADYQEAAAKIEPWLHHLPPPDVAFPLSLQRFAPYYDRASENGIIVRGPVEDYRYIYGLSDTDLEQLAYYFQFDYANGYDPTPTGNLVTGFVADWQQAHAAGARLTARLEPTGMTVTDTRGRSAQVYRFGRAAAALYRFCESPQRPQSLVQAFRRRFPADYLRASADLSDTLEEMRTRSLFYEEGDRLLALAAPEAPGFWLDEGKLQVAQLTSSIGTESRVLADG